MSPILRLEAVTFALTIDKNTPKLVQEENDIHLRMELVQISWYTDR
jgi:hypothetical protein